MNVNEIGRKIKKVREKGGLTLDDIALKVGVAKSTIQRYETGKIENPKLPVLQSIADVLDVNPLWLIGKSSEMNIPSKKMPVIMEYYNKLNDLGKREATKRVEELTMVPKYANEFITTIAAHNNHLDKDEELEKVQRDINNLKSPK